jgi:hypothetical protein
MSVSTKPAARPGAVPSAAVAAGPIPAPRVIGNRRIRAGGIALAVMLLALGAALSGFALVSATRTSAYLAVQREVSVGAQISADDLTSVQLSSTQGLDAIPVSQINAVIGKRAAVSLVPGGLLVLRDLTDQPLVNPGDAEISVPIRFASIPSSTLAPGDEIILVNSANQQQYNAKIVEIIRTGADGSVVLHLAVDPNDAPTLVALAVSGGLTIYLKSKG